jgi:hypothetical protein
MLLSVRTGPQPLLPQLKRFHPNSTLPKWQSSAASIAISWSTAVAKVDFPMGEKKHVGACSP